MVAPLQYQDFRHVTSERTLPGNPPPSRSKEDRDLQTKALTTPVKSGVVKVEYVDKVLGVADAREVETGELVSLNTSTTGVSFDSLEVGLRLVAQITQFQHAVKVSLVSR